MICLDCDTTITVPSADAPGRFDVACSSCGLVHTIAYDPGHRSADGTLIPWRVVGFATRPLTQRPTGRPRIKSVAVR